MLKEMNFRCYFGAHWILKGVPKSTFFEKIGKDEKKEVQETALKKYDLMIDF